MKREGEKNIGGGLAALPKDERDFSRTAVFGAIRAEALPEGDFMIAPPLAVKDQGDTDECTAFATVNASEDQEGIILDPAFTFFATKVLVQKSPETWGADLRSACKAHVKFGALEETLSPFRLWQDPPTREDVLDPKNWTDDHKSLAYEHRKNTFFAVDGPHDTFDNIRAALWHHRASFRSVITGATWRASWSAAPGGKIPKEYEEHGTPHAFIFKGQKYFDGEPHLVAELSNGDDIGEKGFFYFPREVVNKEFLFGMFMFEDLPREKVENHLYYGTSEADFWFVKWFKILVRIFMDNFNKK